VYASASFAAVGRGLLPLAREAGARGLIANPPLWSLLALFGAFSLLWGTTVARLANPDAPAFTLIHSGSHAYAVAELLRSTAAAFPRAGSIIMARVRPGSQEAPPWWTIVEVDGRTLRAAPDAASIQAALAAAGVSLDEGDRIVVVPNQGGPLRAPGPSPSAAGSAPAVSGPVAAARLAEGLSPPGVTVLPGSLPLAAAGALEGAASGRILVQRAVPFSVVDSGVPVSAKAAAATVGEALQSAGLAVDEADLVQPPVDATFVPGMRISIVRAQHVTIEGMDLSLETRTRAATVGDLLAERNVWLGPLDRVEPSPGEAIPAGGTVRVIRVREEELRELHPVPFRTVTQYSGALIPGTRVRTRDGVAGLLERIISAMFEDDREVRRVVVGEAVVRAPIDEIIVVGPSVVPAVAVPGLTLPLSVPRVDQGPAALDAPEGPAVQRALTMMATAYDPGPLSTGKRPGDRGYGVTASGMRAGYGVVAVDPRVIPLGTRLYIPGYGYAIAGDTGSAIVGNRIDLGFATYAEAIRFGRRFVAVYVLQ
jgi:uncharacterized protein YabE (DUF348 family)/3D (Asp-Asp-Asp) domain-containing protein